MTETIGINWPERCCMSCRFSLIWFMPNGGNVMNCCSTNSLHNSEIISPDMKCIWWEKKPEKEKKNE